MKKLLSAVLVLALMFAFAGCGEKESENKTKEDTSEVSSTVSSEKVESTSSEEPAAYGMLKKGLWEVVRDGKRTGYYYFSEDGKECKYRDVELKGGIPIIYEIKDNGYIFHMAALDDNTPVTLKEGYVEGAESVTLVFSDREDQIKYLKDCTIEEFTEQN